jgi:hypothetical protein
MATNLNNRVQGTNIVNSSAGQLKVMRLAQSCNGEYANYFGATDPSQVALVLAAFNNTLTRCNGCYEKDLGVHLNLIAGSTAVIYYNPATDPYTTLANWNLQLQQALTANVGSANYDIGHMFGASGGGGNAGCIGCVCVDPPTNNSVAKGGGITSPADGIPMGDNFDIDYVVHEVGHQLGANHTFSMSFEGFGVNKEVGSGITIMGYAGITPQDVAPHSIDIYHEASIAQIQNNLATKSCPVTTDITAVNATPVVSPVSSYIIPISTPFMLTGSATDANAGDVLTYCWEQNDDGTSGTTGGASVASPTKTVGPNFLSFSPTTLPSRTFPRLATILAGNNVTGPLPGGDAGANIEALSSVGRTLNFRLTVRDNSTYNSTVPIKVGQTAFTDMVVTVLGTAGPFNVTAPNSVVTLTAGLPTAITWSVNGTNAAPINTANVKISLSTDGGLTFPTVLAASTANDGTETLTMPCITTNTARIKVESIGNIYFDISNTNFSIQPGFEFGTAPTVAATCPVPSTLVATLPTITACAFATPINVAASNLPAGTTVTFGSNPVAPGSPLSITLNNTNTLAAGTYTITITGSAAGAPVKLADVSFTINTVAPPVINTQPVSQTVCVGSNVTFSVAAANASTYQWQVNTGSGFTNIPTATGASYTVNAVTAAMNGYQYQVVVGNACSTSINSSAALLTVISPVVLSAQPVATREVCSGGNTTLSVTTTSSQPVSYQWQVSTDGVTYTNLGNAAPYSGVNTNTLTITAAGQNLSGLRYRVAVSNTTCTGPVFSAASLLTVRALPSITLFATPYTTLLPGQTTTLTAVPSASTGGTISTNWLYNNSLVANTGNTRVVNVEQVGTYQVNIFETWASSLVCSNSSPVVTILAGNSNRLFLFPSPNDGQFTLSYRNDGGSSTTRSVKIYNASGMKVYDETFNVTGVFTLKAINIKPAATGIYRVVVGDMSGKVLAKGSIAVQ